MERNAVNVRNCHLLVGGLGLLLFVLQGQYMARVLGVEHLADASRMMYRSAHIYFLLVCVANVSVGYYMPRATPINFLQRLISAILLASPVLLIASFLTESTAQSLDRPIATIALYLLFGSATLLLLHEVYRTLKGRPKSV
jgi:intracellular septation protein A